MASSGTQQPPTLLDRKKKEIVDRSMAQIQQTLDRRLDNSVSAPAWRRPAKRPRDTDDPAAADAAHPPRHGAGETGVVKDDAESSGGGGGGKTKRVKRESKQVENGRKFACPFSKHDPAKYRNVKTCCGPGWNDVHRVKYVAPLPSFGLFVSFLSCLLSPGNELLLTQRSLEKKKIKGTFVPPTLAQELLPFCPRCFAHFDKPEALKDHQRAAVPCELKDQRPDAVTEEQERRLRVRAKGHCSEEERWREMYRILWPGEAVPSPCKCCFLFSFCLLRLATRRPEV